MKRRDVIRIFILIVIALGAILIVAAIVANALGQVEFVPTVKYIGLGIVTALAGVFLMLKDHKTKNKLLGLVILITAGLLLGFSLVIASFHFFDALVNYPPQLASIAYGIFLVTFLVIGLKLYSMVRYRQYDDIPDAIANTISSTITGIGLAFMFMHRFEMVEKPILFLLGGILFVVTGVGSIFANRVSFTSNDDASNNI